MAYLLYYLAAGILWLGIRAFGFNYLGHFVEYVDSLIDGHNILRVLSEQKKRSVRAGIIVFSYTVMLIIWPVDVFDAVKLIIYVCKSGKRRKK